MKKLKSILLVEDDKSTAFITRMLISDLKITNKIEIAENGEEALKVFKEGRVPDLILLDLNMPVMDGFEFLEVLNSSYHSVKENIKIIILSSAFKKTDLLLAEQFSVDSMLEKPLTEEKLLKVIQID